MSDIFCDEYGMTPKAYMDQLRLDEARHFLTDSHKKIIDIAYATGFGSLSAFYKFFKKELHCTPSSYRKKVKKDIMKGFAVYEFPFGLLRIDYEDDCVIFLKKIEGTTSYGQRTAFSDHVFAQVQEYLQGQRKSFSFPYRLKGTDFEEKVWQALLQIPYGETRTYKEIATAIGNPRSSRAVGMANNRNPITLAVPCHRVIGSNGKLTGYAGGLEMKKKLLALERKNKSDKDEESRRII